MVSRVLIAALLPLLAVVSTVAQGPLPMRQIVLFKNGMAHILRIGEIAEPTSLAFHGEDMNDILKSFTAWNPDALTLYSTGYSSAVPIDNLLDRYDFDLRASDLSLPELIKQFRGHVLSVSDSSGSHSGRVVAIERKDRSRGEAIQQDDQLTLLAQDQQFMTFWMSDLRGIRFQEKGLNDQLAAYLAAMSEGTGDSLRRITVYPMPAAGPVRVAYVQQFPVWKTSYRLELEGEPSIQGWALVDNPTSEAWDSVDLTLVAGLPTSFRMELYPPVLRDRPTVPLPLGELSQPIVAQSEVRRSGMAEYSVTSASMDSVTEIKALVRAGRNSVELLQLSPGSSEISFPEPESGPTQDYFEYRFQSPITLQAGQSALLPFFEQETEVAPHLDLSGRKQSSSPQPGGRDRQHHG